jgi:hypothetical protein
MRDRRHAAIPEAGDGGHRPRLDPPAGDLLGEMSFARLAGAGGLAVTPERLWQMATHDGAEVVDCPHRAAPRRTRHVTVFGGSGRPAAVSREAEDVRLVLIDGLGYYGDAALEADTAVNDDCEPVDACGAPKYLCAANTPGAASRAEETVEDLRAQLVAILEGTGYPAEEQYGRGDELLELVAGP